MTDKPIIFSAPMVRALLDGRKTQTRRVLKPRPPRSLALLGIYGPGLTAVFSRDGDISSDVRIPLPYRPKQRLWVREAWAAMSPNEDACPLVDCNIEFKADTTAAAPGNWDAVDANERPPYARWKSPIHMPRWASRLTLAVTQVRVQRLQDISEEDAVAEGFASSLKRCPDGGHIGKSARDNFRDIWECLHGLDSWDANPWVTALTFTVHRANIDGLP